MEEVVQPKVRDELKDKLHQLYDYRLNRFKARLSALYPEQSSSGDVNVSRFRSTTMMEVVSYMDTQTQLHLKAVNRYFNKLIIISHNDVSLTAHAGWFAVIHLSSFLKRIRLYGEPKEQELNDFTKMLENDGFTELSTIELYHIGEWAMLEILEALSHRVQRVLQLGILDDHAELNLVIQETDITPFFARKLADNINSTLYRVLTRLRIIVQSTEGVEQILRALQLSRCSHLLEIDLASLSLLRHGFELLVQSLWLDSSNTSGDIPRIRRLILPNTGLSDPCMISLADVASRGYLSNMEVLDLAANSLSNAGMDVLADISASYLLPNLRAFILSDNSKLGGTHLTVFFHSLSQGVCPMIEEIAVNNCGLRISDVDALCAFLLTPFAENLKALNLGNNPQIADVLATLFNTLSKSVCHHLQLLCMDGVALHSTSKQALVKWIQHGPLHHLRSLSLNNTEIDQKGFYSLMKALTFSSIQDLDLLDLSSNPICTLDDRYWEAAVYGQDVHGQHCITVRRFEFSHNPITNADMEWICLFIQRFWNVHLLQEASFEDHKVSSRGLSAFFKMFPEFHPGTLSKLSVVSMSVRCIGTDLFNWLCSPATSNLRRLILTNCNLCQDDLTCLLTALEKSKFCQKIQYLKLSGNFAIDDAFMSRFIEVYSIEGVLSFLYELDLSYTNITKVGCYELLEFFKSRDQYSLRRLNLGYTRLSANRINILFGEFKQHFKGGCMF